MGSVRLSLHRKGIANHLQREMVVGDAIRDWAMSPCDPAIFPYDSNFAPCDLKKHESLHRMLWPYRTSLGDNKMFGGRTKLESGLVYYEYGRLFIEKRGV
jgi:hypothetical protein